MSFGENLRNLRKERGLSIKELAEKSGVSATQISYYEHNHFIPYAKNVYKLSVALGCSYEDLNR